MALLQSQIRPCSFRRGTRIRLGSMDGEEGVGNVRIEDLDIYLAANVNLGMFYFGGQFAYLEGDDPGSSTRSGGATGQTVVWIGIRP